MWSAHVRYEQHHRKGRKQFEQVGDFLLPTAMRMVITGHDREPDGVAEFEIRDGRPECVQITITAKPDGRAIRSSDVQPLGRVDELITSAFGGAAREVAEEEQDDLGRTWRKTAHHDATAAWSAQKVVADRRRTRANTPEELAEVARIYRENIDGAPIDAVQTLMGYGSHRTAARRVERARAAGLLPATGQGKRKA